MGKGFIWTATGAMALCVAVAGLQATPIYLGSANLKNSGDATEAAWVQSVVDAYNAASASDLPTLPKQSAMLDALWQFEKTELSDDPKTEQDDVKSFSVALPAGADYGYVLLKWGGGSQNPMESQLWYLEAGDQFTAVSPVFSKGKGKTGQGGLSHWDFWYHEEPIAPTGTKVPDGGATLAFLGMSLLGLAAARRVIA